MKPIFTNRGQPLTQILPDWCAPLARCLSPQPEPKVYLYEVFLIAQYLVLFFWGGGGICISPFSKRYSPTTYDHKITPKEFAFRPKAVLANLVDNDQLGFLKGCSIAEDICWINNIIS